VAGSSFQIGAVYGDIRSAQGHGQQSRAGGILILKVRWLVWICCASLRSQCVSVPEQYDSDQITNLFMENCFHGPSY
jgi:hypothetical protein